MPRPAPRHAAPRRPRARARVGRTAGVTAIAGLLVLGGGTSSATLASSGSVVDGGVAGPRSAPVTAPAAALPTPGVPTSAVTGDGTVALTRKTIEARKAAAAAAARKAAAARAARSAARAALNASPRDIARALLPTYGWNAAQFTCLSTMWFRESSWNPRATNPSSGAYGIPQALPGSKMATFGPDWRTNATTQIRWGFSYIKTRYGSPCQAWSFWQQGDWY